MMAPASTHYLGEKLDDLPGDIIDLNNLFDDGDHHVAHGNGEHFSRTMPWNVLPAPSCPAFPSMTDYTISTARINAFAELQSSTCQLGNEMSLPVSQNGLASTSTFSTGLDFPWHDTLPSISLEGRSLLSLAWEGTTPSFHQPQKGMSHENIKCLYNNNSDNSQASGGWIGQGCHLNTLTNPECQLISHDISSPSRYNVSAVGTPMDRRNGVDGTSQTTRNHSTSRTGNTHGNHNAISSPSAAISFPPSSSPSSSSSSSPTGLVEPLRALSAYNFFFRDERDRILNGTEQDWSPHKQHALLLDHWQRDRGQKRRHRKTHGKINFTTLSKEISSRWKVLPESAKEFYRQVAALDWQRYHAELKQYKLATIPGSMDSFAKGEDDHNHQYHHPQQGVSPRVTGINETASTTRPADACNYYYDLDYQQIVA